MDRVSIRPELSQAVSSASVALLDRSRCQQSLHEFVRQAWPYVAGRTPFIDSWAIGAICEHLEAVFRGQIAKLIVNIPPRTGKTNIISICWPAWVLASAPHVQFLFASYAQKISIEHSRKCKQLIESPWYQNRWGDIVQLSKDQATKTHFVTTQYGHRIATSVSAGGTAMGGNILVMDDPNDASDGESKVTRDSTNEWYSSVWSTRLNPGDIMAEVLVQQRVHQDDVTGYIERLDEDKEWVRLILPMEFESNRKCRTIILPSTKGKVWEDPRKEDGELLSPDYITPKMIQYKKLALGSYNYAGQYQQRPSPEEGGLIQRGWFRIWTEPKLPKIQYMVQSWDTALTDKKKSDYSACSTWGTFIDENKVTNVILLYVWKARINYPELLKRATRLYRNCSDVGNEPLKPNRDYQPDALLIEAKAAGHPLISEFSTKGLPVKPFNPGEYGDKTNRVNLVSSFIECGRVWVLGNKDGKITKEHDVLVEDCCLFPNGESDDLVDTLTQTFLYLKKKGILVHSMDLDFTREQFPKENMPRKKEELDYRKRIQAEAEALKEGDRLASLNQSTWNMKRKKK